MGDGEGAVATADGGDEIGLGVDGEQRVDGKDVGEAVSVEIGSDKPVGADGHAWQSLEGAVAVAGEEAEAIRSEVEEVGCTVGDSFGQGGAVDGVGGAE